MVDVLIALSTVSKPFVGYRLEKFSKSQLTESVQDFGDRISDELGLNAILLSDSRLTIVESDAPMSRQLPDLEWLPSQEAVDLIPRLLENSDTDDRETPVTGYEITDADIVNLYALKSGKTDEISREDLDWLKETGLVLPDGKLTIDPDDLK